MLAFVIKFAFIAGLCAVAIWADVFYRLESLWPDSWPVMGNVLLVFLAIEVLAMVSGMVFFGTSLFLIALTFFVDVSDTGNAKDARRLRAALGEVSRFIERTRGMATFLESDLKNLDDLSTRLLKRLVEAEEDRDEDDEVISQKQKTDQTGDHERTIDHLSGDLPRDSSSEIKQDRDDFGLEL